MRWLPAALGLGLAGVLAWASVPGQTLAVALEPVGAGEVVPAGFAQVNRVLQERAGELEGPVRRALATAIATEAGRAGLDPLLVLAVIDVESNFQRHAVSPRGARGWLQIRPSTLKYLAEKEGIDDLEAALAEDPLLDVRLGVRYLKSLVDRFGSRDSALFAYNLGPTKMRRVRQAKQLWLYRRYVRAVNREYARLKGLDGPGDGAELASRAPADDAR